MERVCLTVGKAGEGCPLIRFASAIFKGGNPMFQKFFILGNLGADPELR